MSEYVTTVEPTRAEFVSFGVPEVASRETAETTPGIEVVPSEQPTVVTDAQPETAIEVVETAPTAEVVNSDEASSEEALNEQEKLFRDMFTKTFGMEPEALKSELETARAEKQKAAAEKELSKLQTSWGVDDAGLSQRLELINKRMQQLPEAARSALDNYDGINLIWNSIVAEQGMGGYQQALPSFERSSVVTPQQAQPMFTREQLRSMPADEYRRRNDEILYAYQNNLVV